MPNSVTMEYLQANGRFRRAKAHTESQWPNFLINHSDKQAHSLIDTPVYQLDGKSRRFKTWDELISASNPELDHFPDRLVCTVEDQSIWPLSNNYVPDIADRQLQFKEMSEDAEQNAVMAAARDAGGGGLASAWQIASLMIFCIVAVVILLIALQSDLAQQIVPDGILPKSDQPITIEPIQ